jgi:hypothetical protein
VPITRHAKPMAAYLSVAQLNFFITVSPFPAFFYDLETACLASMAEASELRSGRRQPP